MQQYHNLVQHVLEKGIRKANRTGVDTISTFNYNYSIDLRDGFPLITTKEISWKNIVIENLWFLSGETNIQFLRKHKCKFWDPWANKNGDVPSAYGNFWRKFPVHGFPLGTVSRNLSNYVHSDFNDQIKWVVDQIQRNPMSRRHVVTAWYPGNAQESRLPPCHVMFIFNVQNEQDGTQTLNLHLTQRSADIALGVPYNIAGYAFILEVVSKLTGYTAGRFAHSIVDAHIYTSKDDGLLTEYDHIPGLKDQLTREPRPLPKLEIDKSIKTLSDVESCLGDSTDTLLKKFHLKGYNPHPPIKFRVAV